MHYGDGTETRVCTFGELRVDARGRAPVIRGYAIVFDSLSENLGGFRERIAPSAVDRTLKDGIDLRALVDHDPGKVIGRLSARTLRVEKESRGLAVEIDPPDTSVGQDLIVSIRRGDVTGMSFSFRTMPNGEEWNFQVDPPVRTVTDMLIRELSAVAFPAYPQTEVALRALAVGRSQARGRPMTVAERLAWSAARR